ncbi:MAG: hypothetical protein FWC33_00125 [Candidatus Bathyarchaeota archaeon]|nr:hypothetical protein [Candidatus Termiticorpusculum sp.]
MKKHLTKIIAPLLSLLIVTSLVALPSPVVGQTSTQKKAMDFMENMLQIDLSKYTINIISDATLGGIPLTNGNRKIHDILYELTSENSKLHVAFVFEKDIMTSCGLYELEGKTITKHQYTNPFDAAKDFLERYQIYTNIDSNNLIAILNNVDTSKDSITIIENTKLTITPIFGKTTKPHLYGHML